MGLNTKSAKGWGTRHPAIFRLPRYFTEKS